MHGVTWCAASVPAWGLLCIAYGALRKTPYAAILRPGLVGTPLAVALTGWIPGWPGIAVRWMAFFVVAAWHHSALQALREWTRFDVVIGPRERS